MSDSGEACLSRPSSSTTSSCQTWQRKFLHYLVRMSTTLAPPAHRTDSKHARSERKCRADSINVKLPLGSPIFGRSIILQSVTFMKQVRARRRRACMLAHGQLGHYPEEFPAQTNPPFPASWISDHQCDQKRLASRQQQQKPLPLPIVRPGKTWLGSNRSVRSHSSNWQVPPGFSGSRSPVVCEVG